MKNTIFIITILSLIFTTPLAFADLENVDATATSTTEQILQMAGQSTCAKYAWKNRGRAPAGYIKGVALSFARSVCRIKINNTSAPAAKILNAADTNDSKKDALTYYKNVFSRLGILTSTPGVEAVQAIYSLGMGLGMRESSGKYCEGWDKSAGSNRPSSAAESGTFQVSYDSMAASSELKKLYQEYQATPERCLLSTFQEGVKCKSQDVLGDGEGAKFQVFNKACPAFAAEYAMILLRLRRSHFGPINRKEAEVNPNCESLLKNISDFIEINPQANCEELY